MKTKWCIALENIGPYTDPVLGVRYKFLKGEPATKEKVFSMIPDMTEEEYAKCFRPATEEEINGEFEWDGYQYILKKPLCMSQEEIASVLGHKPYTFEQMKEIEAMHLQHDWDALRNQAAIAAMQGTITILSDSDKTAFREIVVVGFNGSKKTYPNEIAEFAVACADALIEELKKK